MRILYKVGSTLTAMVLALGMSSAQAALWNFTLTGEVIYADYPNDYDLGETSPVTVEGIFDDSVLTAGTGTISFTTGNPYGNTFVVTAGDITFTPDEETSAGVDFPRLIMDAWAVDFLNNGFQFYASDTTTGATFNSYFGSFDGDADFNFISGDWVSFSVTPVPVPAAVWLLGSGLLGLVGIARRKARV